MNGTPSIAGSAGSAGSAVLTVVDAGTQPGSLASRLGAWTARRVADEAAAEGLALGVHHVVLAEIADDVGQGLLDCAPRAGAARAVAAVERADVLVAVSPVHNASYSALFKAFLDQVPRGTLAGVPTLMALAGGSQRHGLVLDHVMRPYLATLRALVVPTAIDAHRGDWLPHDMPSAALDARIGQGALELVALAGTASRLRRAATPA